MRRKFVPLPLAKTARRTGENGLLSFMGVICDVLPEKAAAATRERVLSSIGLLKDHTLTFFNMPDDGSGLTSRFQDGDSGFGLLCG